MEMIKSNAITFGVGPAGTGKTFLAVAAAVAALNAGLVKRIVLIRPVVEAGENLGFLPGSFQDKLDPYLRPLYDSLNIIVGSAELEKMITSKVIETAPIAYMRGQTFTDSFIIMDEFQNATIEQAKMVLTRLGAGSTMVINGDMTQIDLVNPNRSGLIQALDYFHDVEGISIHRFSHGDVVRHPVVQRIIEVYEEKSGSVR